MIRFIAQRVSLLCAMDWPRAAATAVAVEPGAVTVTAWALLAQGLRVGGLRVLARGRLSIKYPGIFNKDSELFDITDHRRQTEQCHDET